jgi:hypothetical protein
MRPPADAGLTRVPSWVDKEVTRHWGSQGSELGRFIATCCCTVRNGGLTFLTGYSCSRAAACGAVGQQLVLFCAQEGSALLWRFE